MITQKKSLAIVDNEQTETSILPLEERLLKLSELFEKQKKYNQLQSTLQNLEDFKLDSDDKITLELTDKFRRSFSTSNSEVINQIIQVLKTTIITKIKEIEPKLIW